MDSPVLIPYASLIQVDRSLATPIYLQVVHQIINAIQRGYLLNGHKMPGSRRLAAILGLHRNTLVASYAELEAQGWIEVVPNSGTYVNAIRSERPRKLGGEAALLSSYPQKPGFTYRRWAQLEDPFGQSHARLAFDDGLPDTRMSHLDHLSRLLHTNMRRRSNQAKLSPRSRRGQTYYQENLANFLNLTRGLHIAPSNMLVTRSQELSVYIVAETLISPGEHVIVGDPSYFATNMILQKAGARITTVPVDEDGIDVEAVRDFCERYPLRLLYVTPHHHYPTTVPLKAYRRLALLELAVQYGFVILEDDYDYDFHYEGSPLLPMASADSQGMVVYVGTFGKSLASGFRSGFIVAPAPLINEMAKLLAIMDRYGDVLTELALGELIDDGEIHRYLKKATLEYRARRDYFAALLDQHLGSFVQYEKPAGGLAIWTSWPQSVNLLRLANACSKHDLYLPRYLLYQSRSQSDIRFGFGSLNEAELAEGVQILADSLHEAL